MILSNVDTCQCISAHFCGYSKTIFEVIKLESDKSKELNLNSSFPKVLTVSDLCYRWEMTRQGIHRKIKVEADFPKPIQFVSNGKIALFLESDICQYEEKKPWVADTLYRADRQEWIFKNVIMQ